MWVRARTHTHRQRRSLARWKDYGAQRAFMLLVVPLSWPWLATSRNLWRELQLLGYQERKKDCGFPGAARCRNECGAWIFSTQNTREWVFPLQPRRKGEREWIFARGGCFLLHKTRFVCGASTFILRFQEGLEAIIGSSGDTKDKLYASKFCSETTQGLWVRAWYGGSHDIFENGNKHNQNWI